MQRVFFLATQQFFSIDLSLNDLISHTIHNLVPTPCSVGTGSFSIDITINIFRKIL